MADMETKTGIFADLMPSGAGFITFEDGRQAFVLPSLIRKMELQLGDHLSCRLAPNFADKTSDRVPWRVIHASLVERPKNDPVGISGMEQLTSRCFDFLSHNGGAWTVADIAEDLGTSVEERFVSRALMLLFDRGLVFRATIEGSDTNREAFYSTTLDELIPIGACEDDG